MERQIEITDEDWSKLLTPVAPGKFPVGKLTDAARAELANIALERLLTEAEAKLAQVNGHQEEPIGEKQEAKT